MIFSLLDEIMKWLMGRLSYLFRLHFARCEELAGRFPVLVPVALWQDEHVH
jgi:hypothetical protein